MFWTVLEMGSWLLSYIASTLVLLSRLRQRLHCTSYILRKSYISRNDEYIVPGCGDFATLFVSCCQSLLSRLRRQWLFSSRHWFPYWWHND